MIPSLALMLALNGSGDPFQVGPINFAMRLDREISMLGPTVPTYICGGANVSYTDQNATVTIAGLTMTFVSHPSRLVTATKRHPFMVSIARLSPKVAPIWSWRFMGYPIFAMADRLPGFITARPRKGERLHLYRPGQTMREGTSANERIDYYLMTDGTVVISRIGWAEQDRE